jgi:hypothetical protein
MTRMNWDRVHRERNLINTVTDRRYKAAEEVGRAIVRRATRPNAPARRQVGRLAQSVPIRRHNRADGRCVTCSAGTRHIFSTPGGHKVCVYCGAEWQSL